MWHGVAAAILLSFGVFVAIAGVVVYLRMYRKQRKQAPESQDSPHDS